MPNELMIRNQSPEEPPEKLETFDDCMQAAKALKSNQTSRDAAMKDLLVAMARLRVQDKVDDLQVAQVLLEIHKSTGLSKTAIKIGWRKYKEEIDKWWAGELAKKAADDAANFANAGWKATEAERRRLWESCQPIAESPDLLAGAEAIAHKVLGVVNEGAGVRATYLTGTSRLLANKAVRVLRTGATASGKNYPVEQTLKFFPGQSFLVISGASPKSLPYEGGDDADFLKHKLLVIPEAAGVFSKKANESVNEYAVMFRTMLSEGQVVYRPVVTDPMTGERETKPKIKNGPCAVIITTADELDDQLETRCLIQGTDESGEQTEAIVEHALSDFDENAPCNLQPWLDFQALLQLDMPKSFPSGYMVRIPFKKAVRKAFKKWRPKFLKSANMRMRRDVDSFLVAIKASALVHKFQRETAEDGAIVATIDDYRHALEAFDDGLAVAHGHVDEKIVAVVEVVERLRDKALQSDLDPDPESRSVKVSIRDLCKRLRIRSTSTAKKRLDEAVDVGALEYDDSKHGGKGRPHYFRVLKTAAELRAESSGGVFPPVEVVRLLFSNHPKTEEQNEQFDAGARKIRI
jgi:hypothetical protein